MKVHDYHMNSFMCSPWIHELYVSWKLKMGKSMDIEQDSVKRLVGENCTEDSIRKQLCWVSELFMCVEGRVKSWSNRGKYYCNFEVQKEKYLPVIIKEN